MVNEPGPAPQDSAGQKASNPGGSAPEGTVPVGSLSDSSSSKSGVPPLASEVSSSVVQDSTSPPVPKDSGTISSTEVSKPETSSAETASTTPSTDNTSEYGSEYGGEYNHDYAYDYSSSPDSGTPASPYSDSSSTTTDNSAQADAGNGGTTPPTEGQGDSSGASDEEEGGGPVKSFLEHLEDLRWVLVKCATVIFLGLLICILGVNHVVWILKQPLEKAWRVSSSFISANTTKNVGVAAGDQLLWTFKTTNASLGGFSLGTNPAVVLDLKAVTVGDQQLLTLQMNTNSPLEKDLYKGPELVYLDPASPFISSLHIAFYGGMLLAAPFLFYFLGQFILPALRLKEKKYLMRGFLIGLGLFLTGVLFCYFYIAPLALRAAEQYALWMGVKVPEWRAEMYFGFLCKFMLGMGLGFEMPVVILALVKIGILDYQKLSSFRRYMIVVNLIMGALLTTPEVLTQVMMFIPLQLLYEVSIWITYYWEWKAKKKAKAEADAENNPDTDSQA